jgi:hypothetical protein
VTRGQIAPPQQRLSRLAARLLLEQAHRELLGPAPDLSKVAHPVDIAHAACSGGPFPGLDSDKTADELEREREAWRLLRDEAGSFVEGPPRAKQAPVPVRPLAPMGGQWVSPGWVAVVVVAAAALGWSAAAAHPWGAFAAGVLLGVALYALLFRVSVEVRR